jgi:ABC-type cobalamin/Fe3+-siderophores transport system ATPase subunit
LKHRPKIETEDLRYVSGGAEILEGVSVAVPKGEVVCVTGPSGAGKSTMLRALNRLIEPASGEVYLDGEPTGAMDPLELRRRVGMIIGGADPLEAVRLQIVVLYMLLGSVAIAAILVGLLSYRSFFTPRHQLLPAPKADA